MDVLKVDPLHKKRKTKNTQIFMYIYIYIYISIYIYILKHRGMPRRSTGRSTKQLGPEHGFNMAPKCDLKKKKSWNSNEDFDEF